MSTSAALELDFTDPAILAARAICAFLDEAHPLDRPALLRVMEHAYGTSAADGAWSLRDAYDVLEAGQVQYLARAPLPLCPITALAGLTELAGAMPTCPSSEHLAQSAS